MQLYALNTKLRAMRGQLFTKADYEAFCRLGSVAQVADRLREKGSYRFLLTRAEGEWRRRDVEHSVRAAVYSDFFRIRLHVFDEALLEFLNALFLQTLISLMKKLLCMVYDDRDTSHEFNEWDVAFAAEQKIDLPRLAASKTVTDYIDNLKGTRFYAVLNPVADDTSTMHELEQELDLFYYRHIWEAVGKLDDENREIMRRIKGLEIDLNNIIWVYRLKRFYNVNRGDIIAGLVPVSYKLSVASLSRMIDSDTVEGVLSEVAAGPYRDVFKDFDNPERDFTRAIRRSYAKEISSHPFSLAVAAGYLFEKTEEINNVTTALEGVRYGLPAADIMKYLIL